MARIRKFLGITLAVLLCAGVPLARAAATDITVFAAASTTNALTEIAKIYEAGGQGKVALSFASSSTLAKQVENGAPADVFLSANAEWMNYLEEKKLLEAGSRSDLLGNRIVFIVPASSSVQSVTVSPQLDLAAMLGKDGMLSVGDPAHVPVGTYAKAALEHLKLWTQVEKKIAPAKDVRAGLALVERAESPLGIVYASDAVISDKVRVVGAFPTNSHPNIDYPVAAIKTPKSGAALNFIKFLSTPPAKTIWAKYGFEVK
ncbi:MAG: molybdate ABC transporter substrate-binding protein [Deltaproteobacteria bacterium]|jgi:molybdate transport system substrate-binding protein|nr:molybdate ABC transporter substrate-binding protein [Deltaproteobacteria bacterium]